MRSQRRGRGVRVVRREIGVRVVRRVKSVSSRRRASGFLCESWQEWRDGDDENLSTRTGCRLQMMPVSTEHKHSSQAGVAQATSCPPTLAIPPPRVALPTPTGYTHGFRMAMPLVLHRCCLVMQFMAGPRHTEMHPSAVLPGFFPPRRRHVVLAMAGGCKRKACDVCTMSQHRQLK